MKKTIYVVIAVIGLLGLCSCVTSNSLDISPKTIEGIPDAYPIVKKAPNPILLGTYSGKSTYTKNSWSITRGITYWLGKKNDKFVFFAKQTFLSGRNTDSLDGWRGLGSGKCPCTINGNEIILHGTRRIFVQDGKVYYEAPKVGMSPFELSIVQKEVK
ncbi:MAG: hypothetical protein PF690_00095 [Deltaproteobacteria bacterium]|nr:hypothetical protein [Deltaproteobacteria bacterium]